MKRDAGYWTRIVPLLALTFSAMLVTPPVQAADMVFCSKTGTTNGCAKFLVINKASIVVQEVEVTRLREEGPAKCSEPTKSHSQNLAGMAAFDDRFTVSIDLDCAWKFKFKVSKGCIGDKVATASIEELNKEKKPHRKAVLKGACGTLKARTNYWNGQ